MNESELLRDFEVMRIKTDLLRLVVKSTNHADKEELRKSIIKFINSDLAPLED